MLPAQGDVGFAGERGEGLSAPVLIAFGALLIVAGWKFELADVTAAGRLPALVCSESGF